jgi:Na+-transporting NADH:ubiquinone oxidoreductase subunit C
MSDAAKTVLFATALCVACSLLLTLASTGLKGFQQKNALVDQHRNILKAVGALEDDRRYAPEEIEALYNRSIRCLYVDARGGVVSGEAAQGGELPMYLYLKDGEEPAAYIIPVDSRGLWGRIKGYLALEPDGATVAGFAVYAHAETPGLGGEIERRWFQRNFVGKRIVNDAGEFVSVRIAKGAVKDAVRQDLQPHFVDGISGATLTGVFLSQGLESILQTYEPVSLNFRTRGMLRIPEDSKVCRTSPSN